MRTAKNMKDILGLVVVVSLMQTFAKTHWTVDVKYMHLNRETGLNKLKGACVSGNK